MRKKVLLLLSVLLVFMTTTAFSALSQSLTITSEVRFRVLVDIRVNGVALNSATNGAVLGYESDYSKNTVSNGFVLPNSDSSISYTVHIDNNGSVDYAIYDLLKNSSDSGLQVAVSGYNIGDVIPHNSSLDLVLTYTTTNPSENVINVVDTFNFKRVYYVTFETNTSETIPYQLKYEGIPLTLTSTQPTKTGYTFSKWNTKSDGTGVNYTSGASYTADEDKKLYALYTLDTYNITYVLDGGTNNQNNPTTYTYESSDITLGDATKTGYTFKGWTGNGTTTPTKNLVLPKHSTGNKTFTANFTANTYTINYTMNGGNNPSTKPTSGTYDANVVISNPTKKITITPNANNTGASIGNATSANQTFAGWTSTTLGSNAKTGTSASNYSTWNGAATTNTYFKNLKETGSVTMVANWTPVAVTLPSLSKTGYTCKWYTDPTNGTELGLGGASYTPSANSNQAITAYARCTANTYTVTAKANGGSISSTSGWTGTGNTATKSVTYDQAYGTLPTISRPGYTFKGWNGKNLLEEIGEYAERFDGTVRNLITYDSSTGIYTSNTNDQHHIYGYNVFDKVTVGNTYTFSVEIVDKGTGNNIRIGFDMLLNGQRKVYYSSFDVNVGDRIFYTLTIPSGATSVIVGINNAGQNTGVKYKNLQLEEGSSATPYEPYYITSTTPVTRASNHEINAIWERNNYTITYALNNGTVATANPTNYNVETETFTLNNPTKTITFVGHYNAASGANAANGQVTIGSNTTAVQTFKGWSGTDLTGETNKTVTVSQGSTGNRSYTAHWTSVAPTSLPTVSRTGYTCGWSTSSTGTTIQYDNSGNKNFPASAIAENSPATINLYAVCEPNTYTIAYTMNGGTNGTNAPTTGTFDSDVVVSKPSKTFTVNINGNGQNATVKNAQGTVVSNASSQQTFAGWTATDLDTATAKYGAAAHPTTSWNGTTKVGSSADPIYLLNLRSESGTVTLKANWTAVNVTLPNLTKTGYQCKFNTSNDGTGTNYVSGASYTPSTTTNSATLYVICTPNNYNIAYTLNGGTQGANAPTTGTYDQNVVISNPTKTVTITGNVNGTGATVGNPTSSTQTFAGWSSTSIGTTAQTGSSASNYASWNGTTKTKNTYFKNLADTNNAIVTMVANWTPVAITNGLPTLSKVGYNCKWYTEATGGSELGAGGAPYTPTANSADSITVFARCTERDDTAYRVNHYVHDLGTNTYTLDSHDDLTGRTNASVTLANLKKTISGFTYVDGYITGNTTKPTSGAVTTTTILPDGSRVINLYYRRNYLYVQYHVNGGTLNTSNSAYGVSNNLITHTANTTATNFLLGVYESKVGPTNTSTYAIGSAGLLNYNNPSVVNIEYTGYQAKSGAQWNTNAQGTGTSYDQNDQTIDANGFAGADLTTGDKVVTLYVNWVPVNYNISYGLNNGTVSPANPTTYNIESSAITLNNPTKTLTFKGNYNATSGANASSTDGITIGSNTSATQTFKGWSGTGLTGETNTSVTIATGSTGNRTYTAHWIAVAPASLPTVTREGYTCGWSTTNTGTTIQYASGATNYSTNLITEGQASLVNLYAVCVDDIAPTIVSTTPSTTLDLRNYVDFNATDAGSGVAYYNITATNSSPTTWIPVVSDVETTTETKYEYNAAWARVLHQNNHWGSKYFADSTAAQSKTNDNDLYSVLGNIASYKNSTNWEFLLQYPEISSTTYNRWTQTSNPITNTNSVTGYNAIHADWTSSWFGMALSSANTATFMDGHQGSSWWYAIGAYTRYGSGMPGPLVGSTATAVGTANLWSRIDNLTNTTSANLTRRIGDIAADGTYYVWVKDAAGNTTSKSVTINKVDTTKPTATITSTNNVAASQTVTLTLGDDRALDKYYWGTTNPVSNTNVANTTISNNPTSSAPTKTVSDGGTYYVSVIDSAGNRYNTSKVFYKTTLNANSGSVSPASVITMNGNSFTLPTPTRTGYNFAGWYTDSGLTTAVTLTSSKYAPNASATLYAKWTPASYTLTANANGGSIPSTSGWSGTGNTSTKSVTYLSTYGTLPTPTRSGYTFNGWTSDNIFENGDTLSGISTTGIIDETVKYNGSTSVKTGRAWQGIYLNLKKLYDEGKISIGDKLTFSIYYKTDFTLTKNTTFTLYRAYASNPRINVTVADAVPNQWHRLVYKITVDSISIASTDARIEADYYEQSDYTFAGNIWFAAPQIEIGESATGYTPYYVTSSLTVEKTSNHTIKANWTRDNYTITYALNNGTVSPANPTNYNVESAAITLAAPTKTLTFKGNYNATSGANAASGQVTIANNNQTATQTFAGWSGTGLTGNVQNVTIATGSTGNRSYTAHWTAVAPAKLPKVTRTGYTCGWNTSSTGTTIQYASEATNYPTSAITEGQAATVNLYAVCVPNVYTITLNNQSATTAGTATIYEKYATGYYLTNTSGTVSNQMSTSANGITIPVRTGYTFDGYYTAANGGTKYIDASGKLTTSASTTQFSANGTLYAHWTKPVADLTNSLSPTSYIYDGTAKIPTATVKDGSTTLTSGTDYTISYTNNTNVGTATATITGKNVYNSTTKAYYTGTTTVSYYINNATLTFDKGTCTSTSGSTTLYTRKNATAVYTGIRETTTTGTIPTASKTGYTFNGWYTAASGGSKVLNANGTFTGTAVTNYTNTNSWNTTANQTLYAVCTPSEYVVTADANGGSISSTTGWSGTGSSATKSVTYDSTYGTLPTIARTGYTFKGWSLLPNGYTPVEYIQSSGTQYIDTGYYWQHENIEIYFDGTVITNESNQSLFGNEEYTTSSGNARNFAGIPHGSGGSYSIFIGDKGQGSVAPGSLGTRFNLNIVTTTDKKLNVYLNGTNKFALTYTGSVMTRSTAYLSSNTSTTVGHIFLFANHNANRGASNAAAQNISAMRVYGFKLYDNGTLVRDLIPCINDSTGKAGMYDLANGVFYGNSGTGDFAAGNTSYITSSTVVKEARNHTIYALWVDDIAPTKPTVALKHTADDTAYTSDTWTNKQVYTTITSTEAGSGVTEIYYSFDNSTWTKLTLGKSNGVQHSGTSYYGSEVWNDTDGRNITVYFKTKDAAGNYSEVSDPVKIKYDKSGPTITASNITYGSNLSITLADAYSGVVGWQVTSSSTAPTSGWTSVTKTASTTVTKSGLVPGTYYVWSIDDVGNKSSKQVTVSTKPVTVTAGSSNRAWNGSALTNSTCTAESNQLLSGHTVTCTMTSASTITVASTTIGTSASVNNVIDTVTIKDANNNNVTSYYNVTKANGTLTISYATPTISLTAKTANWTGSAIAANTATASPNSSPTFTYTYYTDSSCSTQTTTSHGASAAGGAPSLAGQYYVKASAAAVSTKTNAASSACTSHKINAPVPTVTLTAKEATYTGSAIAANTATVSPNSNPTITYTYYTDSGCSTKTGTTVATGLAASAGAAPVVAGQYYVKASAAAVSGKTAAGSSACVSHKINKKAVTVTAGSSSRAWNGSALTNSSCTANSLGTGDAVTCAMTSASTITLASTTIGTSASVNNVINTVTIKKGSNDVSGSYTITKANGTLTISYATPTISLTAKTANWTGSAIAANTATASPNSSPTFSYVYYTDSSCSTQTTTSHGASAAGGAPSLAGQYYVKANAAAVSQKTNAASSACTSHKINAPVPTVTLTAKEATYTGSAIAANTATVSPNSNPTITYTYYTDSGCSTKTGTTVATGLAASAGAAPVVAGQYYVKASAAAVSGKTAAGSSACVSHKINPKAVTVTAGSDSRAWNGSALTKSSCTANALGTGDSVTCAMTSGSTITLASTTIGTSASVNNVINTVTIKKGSNDVSASYTITKANGTLTISYATPTISLTAKTANWTGSAIAANTASASPNSSPTFSYVYYTDSSCSTQTTTSHGASAAGGAPSIAGQYYVKANAAAVSQKTNAASSACTSHKINAATPTVSLTAKEATYTGSAIAANTATVSPNSNPTITYTYYTDSGCSTKTGTTVATGLAASAGAAPVVAGQYYVKASAAAVSGKTAAATSGCVSHKINPKAVTVTAGSDSRAWNGSALTKSSCTANALGTGDSVTCTMTSASTITLASTTIGTSASVNNVINTVTIKKGSNDVSGSYTITKANGTLTISYATPTISLTAKTANWTGNTIAANAASASPNSSPTFTYTYYTNNTCTTQTTTSHGASAAGGAPSIAGQYYVKANAAAVSQKTNAASSACTSHKINAATPTVSLTAKEATYTGSAIAANTATVSPNSNPTITYTYYTDSGCSTKTGTTVATGLAASAGAAPVVAGQYYVKASAAEVSGKTNAASSACVSHKINPKAVTVTAGSTSRAWNGSALTNSSCTANALGTGDSVTCAMTSGSTITLASTTIGTSASVNNVINTVTIKKGSNDVSGSYTITKANGTLTISYATPTISLTAKTANWTGSAIAANTASASPNSSPTFTYTYYTNNTCTTQTTTSHGASAAGGAPSIAGQYYVKASAAAVSQKTNAASSACTSHKINAATPTVSLTAKEATYTGSAIAANTATVSPNSNPTITYTYYTNSACSTQTGTTVATGLAASAGAAPVVAGQYYVKASAAAVTGKTGAATSGCVSHKINPKAVTVTAGSDSRAWNGSALTKSSCTANSLGTGDAVTCAMTSASTITLASTTIGTSASVNNVINTVTIKKGANDVSASYTITKANGTLTISYANPTISLTAKTTAWTGSAIAANTATASPNSSPTMTYTYYTNNTCTTTTTTSHGASANGGAPSVVGNYYVKASAAAVSQKTNAAASGCIAHTITAATPTVSLTPKETTYTGAAITANTATVSPNSNPTITYAYYTDSGCSTATTAANSGAASNGAAPVYAGQYYVKASAAAVSGKTGAGSSACTSHKINKKAITVTAGTSSRAWNGSALTNSGCTASALGTGDSVTCTMTSGSTITLASTTIGTSASQTNTIDTVTIKKGTVNVSNSYTITKATGTLTISYATPTVTLSNKETAYTGSAISINAPTISPNSNPTLTYNYYTNSTCTTPTSTSNSGAAGTGKPPVYAGQYYAKVSATAVSQKTNAADSNCASLKITKITCPAPTGVSITTAGVVSWTAASGASSYQISIDNTNWTAATSGVNYKNTITAATGSRTVYVRSVCDAANYTSTSSANGTASVTVYSVSLTKGTGISAVSGAGNYISGSTAAIDATVTAGYTWANWTGTSTLTQKANNITVNGNKSYTANTTANTYTVVYNGNGNTGGSTASSTHTYGVAKNLTSNGFTKDGYTFAGWATSTSGAVAYSNGQSVSNLTTTNGGTVNLYAKWNQSTYTMTINPNGGTYNGTTSTSTKTMKYDATDNNDIGVPTYSGYTFQGWYTAQSGGSLIYGTNGKNVALNGYWDAAYNTGKWKKAGNIEIWARWSITDPGIPTITGGTTKIYGASATTLTCTENTSYPAGFTKYYEFGYATSSTGTPSSWVASSNNQYTISTAAGTEFVGTRYYKCRVHVGSGTVNSNNVVSTSPTTMTINNATITLSAGSGATACSTINGQSPAYVNTSMTGVYNSVSGTGSGTIPTASKNGYAFSGFYDGNTQVINGSGQIVASVSGWTDANKKWTITANKTLTAKCSENSYSISYTMNNGTCTTTPPTSYTINSSAITLPTSCSKTISFVPHYSTNASSNATSSSGVSYGSTTTAQQTWIGWTGSNGETAQKTVTIPTGSTGNKSYALRFTAVAGTLPTVARGGYTCGWNANDGQTTRTWGSGGTYATSSITEGMATTVNLYAVCNPNTYKVSFSRNCPSGTGSGGQTADVTATYNAAMPAISTTAPTCSYYTFDGWYDTSAASGGNKYYTAAGASNRSWDKTAATTLYGRWTPVNYTISYNLNNCGTVSGTNPTSYNYASAAITLKNPSKTGYTFTGWTGSNGTTAQTTVTIPNHSNGNKSYTANCTINKYYIDLNAVIGGKSAGNTSGCGKVDVYINNSKVSSQVTDYYQQHNYGTTWKIQNITTSNAACSRSGLATSYSGTVGTSNVNIGVQWSVPTKSYSYTGGMQSYKVPVTGNYRLTVWGAQGNYGYGATHGGGYGGKSIGTVNSLAAGSDIYIGVGGGDTSTANGGYNGGGSGNYIAGDNGFGGGGGGATHMAKTQSALLKNTTPANVYIVAGGGGGSSEASYDHSTFRRGGSGGGTSGGGGSGGSYIGGGGSQDHIGTRGDSDCTNAGFGYGGSSPYGSTTESTYAAGGGGAGWYGGGASSHSSGGTYSTASSGGGGSGRLSGMLAGGASTTAGQRSGSGLATIELVG